MTNETYKFGKLYEFGPQQLKDRPELFTIQEIVYNKNKFVHKCNISLWELALIRLFAYEKNAK